MVKISIVCLIYKSTKMADWVYNSVHKFTPQLARGEAEFFFIANNPTESVVNHLDKKGYKYFLNICPKFTESELFQMGYGKPAYISEVYNGYNRGILEAKGEIVVLINSDNYFSKDWLEGLTKHLDKKSIITSQLVERKHPKYDVFPGAYHHECGNTPENFDESKFLKFAESVRKSGLAEGTAYMPNAFYKDLALQVGLYPEGNIAGESFDQVIGTGDEIFYRMLKRIGVRHFTSLDSIVYHLKEGEMDEPVLNDSKSTETSKVLNSENVKDEIKKIDIIKSKAIELYKRFAYSEVNAMILQLKMEKLNVKFNNEIEKISNELIIQKQENIVIKEENTLIKQEVTKISKEIVKIKEEKKKLFDEFHRLNNSKAVRFSNKLKRIITKTHVKKF